MWSGKLLKKKRRKKPKGERDREKQRAACSGRFLVLTTCSRSLQQWAITWGILIQYFIQYGSAEGIGDGPEDPNQPEAAFRIPWGVQAVPGAVLFVLLFFCPYSPRWLASKDRYEEALQTLANLHAGGDVSNPKVLAEYQEIKEAIRFEREEAVTSFAALTEKKMLKRVLLGMSVQAWSQLSGMNIMMCK